MPFNDEEKFDYELSEEQADAVKKVIDFINSDQLALSLCGSAGTGKTLTLMYILKEIRKLGKQYCLCAPTHKAALVMEQYTKTKAKTLHSLLAMSPKLDILKLNFNQLEFNSGECKDIPYHGLVICDEASMINDDLFDFLCHRCEDNFSKLLLIADDKQLQPVKNSKKSKVFELENKITLTKIFRQDNESALVEILAGLRETPKREFRTVLSEKGNLICTTSLKDFVKQAILEYKDALGKEDILSTKVLAYTNKQVNTYNNTIHKYLFKNGGQYNKHEFLTCQCNMNRNGLEYWNSMDYIIVNDPEEIEIEIPHYGIVPGFKLELYDSLSHNSGYIKMIDKKYDKFDALALTIEALRIEAIEAKKGYSKKLKWVEYFKTIDSFCTPVNLTYEGRVICKKSFDYGYAITVHRSQGSSINKVFIDMNDILKQSNFEELRQLQYVALSRTRKDAILYI